MAAVDGLATLKGNALNAYNRSSTLFYLAQSFLPLFHVKSTIKFKVNYGAFMSSFSRYFFKHYGEPVNTLRQNIHS